MRTYRIYNPENESQEIKEIKAAARKTVAKYSFSTFKADDWKKGVSVIMSTASTSESFYLKFDRYQNGIDFNMFEIRVSNHPMGRLASISTHVKEFSYSELTPELISSLIDEKVQEIKTQFGI
jgi:hypothetical protein